MSYFLQHLMIRLDRSQNARGDVNQVIKQTKITPKYRSNFTYAPLVELKGVQFFLLVDSLVAGGPGTCKFIITVTQLTRAFKEPE